MRDFDEAIRRAAEMAKADEEGKDAGLLPHPIPEPIDPNEALSPPDISDLLGPLPYPGEGEFCPVDGQESYPRRDPEKGDNVTADPITEPVAPPIMVSEGQGLSENDRKRIQDFAKRYGVDVHVVGSRAEGTASPYSDYDYIIGSDGSNSKMRKRARRLLPHGSAGGEINSRTGQETGIDVFNEPLDPTRPHITISPGGGN